jgi:hypothetical protein
MGIRFTCPNGHKLHVKEFLAGKRAICPDCGVKLVVPSATAPSGTTAGESSASGFGSMSIVIPTLDAPAVPPIGPSEFADRTAAGVVPRNVILPPPDATPLVGAVAKRRRNLRRTQVLVAIVLMAIVLILMFVLVMVLTRGSNSEATETAVSQHAAEWQRRRFEVTRSSVSVRHNFDGQRT